MGSPAGTVQALALESSGFSLAGVVFSEGNVSGFPDALLLDVRITM
ncbi:MAG: hypothetical protein AAFU71_09550 [Cyanobacteria bacterium J06632_22]